MLVRALETVYYGDVRRRPALYEDQDDGTTIKKKSADIFVIHERSGLDKDNKPITLSIKDQYLAIKDAVEIVDVKMAEVRLVQAAKIEAKRREQFEREQKEIDDMDLIVKIAKAKEKGEEFSVDDFVNSQRQEVDLEAQEKDLEDLVMVVDDEDEDDPDNPKNPNPEDDEGDEGDLKKGTGNQTVLS